MDDVTKDVLKRLADDFETLMDLENMDWMIFEYKVSAPWFFLSPGYLDMIDREGAAQLGYRPDDQMHDGKLRSDFWDWSDREASELRGRFVETIEALRKAADGL